MSRVWLCLLVGLVAATLWCCSDDDERVVNSSHGYILGDLVHFDSSEAILTALVSEGNYSQSELWVGEDLVVGEPFLDVDGDGVYSPDVDVFHHSAGGVDVETLYFTCDSVLDTTCVNPRRTFLPGWDRMLIVELENQDINYNGVYDGPDADWTPGVPFVDLDEDGEYDREYSSYQPGLPFADFNENGVFNSELTTQYKVERYLVEGYGPDHLYAHIRLATVNVSETYPTFRYISDSGTTYNLNPWYGGVGGLLRFELDSVGLWYTEYTAYPLLLLEHGEIHEQHERQVRITDDLTEVRSISFHQRLTIGATEYDNLVVVDITKLYRTTDTTQVVPFQASFCFSPNELHLLAARLVPPGEDSVWVYLNRRLDTLPLPMIR